MARTSTISQIIRRALIFFPIDFSSLGIFSKFLWLSDKRSTVIR
jgi:hypothetical protein